MQNIEVPKSNIDELVEDLYNELLKRNNIECCKSSSNETNREETKGIGAGIKFQRLRRVTGYLSGRGIDGMNNAKQAEVADRVKHSF